jgi:hypothetical protein
MIRVKSRTLDVATALFNNVELTASQIKAIYDLKNPSRVVHYLRSSGVNIFSKPTVVGTGRGMRKAVRYSLTK